MLKIALNLEYAAQYFEPSILISLGIAILLFGLVIWLSGMALRKLFLLLAGVLIGGLCGLFITGRKIISAIGLAAFSAFIAVVFDRICITILAAALAITIALTIMTWNYPELVTAQNETKENLTDLNITQTFQTLYSCLFESTEHIRLTFAQIPQYHLLIIPVLLVIFIAAGLFFWNLICAWFWATIGTAFIFAGMVFLLLYKGSMPISRIIRNGTYFLAVFVLMMVAGTIIQLLLFHHTKGILRKLKAAAADKQADKPQGWRGL